ncbi:MAG: DEAD/DEAH box helicase [Deltaproteobacteria bacterium]|nr:DEAD/DEAH box helicase [Deltaproteobacteria bacterium]
MRKSPTIRSGSRGKTQKKSVGPEKKPIQSKVSRTHKPEHLELEEWQRLLRKEYGQKQTFKLKNLGDHPLFSDFSVINPETDKTYRVAIRGLETGMNHCSCPDFSINNLGTCKHIEFTLAHLMKKRGSEKAFQKGYTPAYSEIFLHYGLKREVRFRAGKNLPPELLTWAKKLFTPEGRLKEEFILDFPKYLNRLPSNNGHEVRCHDDVMAYIAEHQDREHRLQIIREQFHQGINSPIFKDIIKTRLYPYQREGALFAIKAGRCLIGDDMGLGKTIQAITATELMAKLFQISKVLIVSPTTLKYQWKGEIEKFSSRPVEIIEGFNLHREQQYRTASFYKITNYELVYRDLEKIKAWTPDLIILDEAQRIKNWKTRTAQTVKQLESPFALVLTGTPIENKIEELHSIVEFISRRPLGPLYRFLHNHRIVDEGGKVIGYKDLQAVRETLGSIMIRRKKGEVLEQLPERIDKNLFVPLTKEQGTIHDDNYEIVVRLVAKWRRYKFLCEADQRRLMIALTRMRMAADNTYLVDKKTVHGPKIEELEIILEEVLGEDGEKVVIFSQWLRMTELVERILKRNQIGYVHLNGTVPAKQRKNLLVNFKEDPACRIFLSTDAGGVGLNLQSGSTVINMDIPWNPAVLEQRIGRVHRLGQRKPVRVINFVSSASIEERILDLLKFKRSLFAGALDQDGENVVMIGESQLKRFMQSVETLAENLEKAGPSIARQQETEKESDQQAILSEGHDSGESRPVPVGEDRTGTGLDLLKPLLMSGAEFLMNLSKGLGRPASGETPEASKPRGPRISQDPETGESFLKIPLPEAETIQKIFSALQGVMMGFQGDSLPKSAKESH